jgi:hypothetical protein
MNAQINKPRLSAILGQVATIAKVSTSSLGLRRFDKQASLESDRAHNAQAGTGRTFPSRMAGCEHRCKEVSDLGKLAQNKLKEMTTAWGENQRLLSNAMINGWLEEFMPIKKEFDAKLAQLVADAPQLIATARANKGSYNVEPPTEEEIRNAYALEFTMSQIPNSDTFAATGVTKEVQEEMRRQFEAGIEAAHTNAVNDALTRVAEPLQHLVDRISNFDKTEDEKSRGVVSSSARLYETTITHVQDIAKVFRSFNLTGNALMDQIADRLEAFEGIDIEDIKTSDSLRKDLTKKADAILADLKDLI